MRILVKLPTRERSAYALETLGRWRTLAAGPVAYLLTLDEDDPTVAQLVAALPQGVEHVIGRSASKVEACNRDLDREFDILVLASDDMTPQLAGWDLRIIGDMRQHWPDLDGVLHYPDSNRGDIITLPILGRKYYDRFGYVYHPDYRSLWCDNEMTDVARGLGRYWRSDVALFRHAHPAFRTRVSDDLQRRNDQFFHLDRKVYQARRNTTNRVTPLMGQSSGC